MRVGQDAFNSEDEDFIDAEREDDSYGHEKGRLLQDFDESSSRDQPHWTLLRYLSNHFWTVGWIAGLLVIIVTFVILLLTMRRGHGVALEAVVTNDYLLDPRWDASSPPQRREYFWTIRDVMHNPDGVFRPMIVVNNQYPGPLIEANEGDTIVVHVRNEAVNATSIHWHGIYQNGTPHMDGTVGVSQCPIPPHGRFTYEFTVTGQSGTYWWHAHHGVQSSDGLHGPLVIHGRNEKRLQQIEYATDRVILVSDHYHDLSSALLWQYLAPDMENREPVPIGAVINGRARRDCVEFADRICNEGTSLTTLNLRPNSKNRLRFVNVGAFAEFQIQLDEHELTVTEVDGTDVHPTKYHRINVSPAQRYSVIVDANVTTSESFWLRARMVTQCFTDPPENMQSEVRAIVRYDGGSKMSTEEPKSKDWEEMLLDECTDMDSTELVPVEVSSPPEKPDAFFYLRSNFEIGPYRLSRGFFNGTSWRPTIQGPSLLRASQGLKHRDPEFLKPENAHKKTAFVNDAAFDLSRELVIQTTEIQTIDILVSNFDDGDHPLHLHGYKYWVLAQGHGYPPLTHVGADINVDTLKPLYESLNLANPLRRDTATVEAFGWILFRFVANNPGAWAFHCHLSWHAEAGLLMQFLTMTEDIAWMTIPDDNLRLCSAPGVMMGAGPRDEDYWDLAK